MAINNGWRYVDRDPWGKIRLRPRHPISSLLTLGFATNWEVEWLAGSQTPEATEPTFEQTAVWISGENDQWHPLLLPRGRRNAVIRAAYNELAEATNLAGHPKRCR